MNDVFISYSRRDKVFVQKLYDCLASANRTVWADWRGGIIFYKALWKTLL